MPRPPIPAITDPAFPHGTPSGYAHGCHDDASCPATPSCRQARNVYQRVNRLNRIKNAATTTASEPTSTADETSAPESGTSEVPTATSAPKPQPAKPTAEGRTATIGATRRLQGLVFMGYTPVALAQHTRISVDNIWWLLIDPPDTIQDITHRIIAQHFQVLRSEPLSADRGTPAARAIERARSLAATHDWKSAWSWGDIDTDALPAHPSTVAAAGRHPQELRRQIAELEQQLKTTREALGRAQDQLLHLPSSTPAPAPHDDTALLQQIDTLTADLDVKASALAELHQLFDQVANERDAATTALAETKEALAAAQADEAQHGREWRDLYDDGPTEAIATPFGAVPAHVYVHLMVGK